MEKKKKEQKDAAINEKTKERVADNRSKKN
jgi:hypothetical protein